MKNNEEEAAAAASNQTNKNQCDHTIKNKRILMPINSNEPKKDEDEKK